MDNSTSTYMYCNVQQYKINKRGGGGDGDMDISHRATQASNQSIQSIQPSNQLTD